MANKRSQIQMTPAEMWAFIGSQKSLQVATLDKAGAPHLATLWFAVVNEQIVFHTYAKSQKIVNLRRDARLAALLEDGESYESLRGVSMQGTAVLLDGEEKYPLIAAVLQRYSELDETAALAAAHTIGRKRTLVKIVPTKIATWDHRKLDSPNLY